MKKTIIVLLIAVLVFSCFSLTGCGGSKPSEESKYVGAWSVVKAELKGEEQDLNEVLGGTEFNAELKADGTAVVTTTDGVVEGTWTETGSGIRVKGKDLNMKLKDVDGMLVLSIFGVELYFEKQ